MRAWAEREVASEDGHQVGASRAGVTQCILPLAGILLPLLGGSFPLSKDHTPCPSSFPPCVLWHCEASELPFLSAAQIH